MLTMFWIVKQVTPLMEGKSTAASG